MRLEHLHDDVLSIPFETFLATVTKRRIARETFANEAKKRKAKTSTVVKGNTITGLDLDSVGNVTKKVRKNKIESAKKKIANLSAKDKEQLLKDLGLLK